MTIVLSIALSNSLGAAVLALIAAGLSKLVRRPALTHVLWVLVLLKLLTPPVWTIPVPMADTGVPSAAPAPEVHGDLPGSSSVPQPAPAGKINRRPTDVNLWSWLPAAVMVTWGAGSAILVGLAGLRLRRFSTLLRFARLGPSDVQQQAGELATKIGLRRCPGVWFLPGPVCPMLWAPGLGARLVIPSELWDRLSLRQRAGLLLHELAHLRRGDHWVRGIELLATTLYWWNPLLWWARRELREAEEQCCDAWVTWALPAANHEYASALVEAVEFASTTDRITAPLLPALASGIGEFGHLKRRLVMIQQGNGNRSLGTTGIICVCAAAVLLPLALSRAQQHDTAAPATARPATTQPQAEENIDAALRKQLERQLPELQFDGVGFSDVVDFLRDVSGANIFVNWKSLEEAGIDRNTPITARLRNVKFSKALNVILDSAGGGSGRLVWKADGNVLAISALGAGAKVIQRSYDVKDLAPDAGKADSLVRMITGSIDADSWKDNGGKTGTIQLENGKLVVTQTQSNQKSIANLLARARELLKTGH